MKLSKILLTLLIIYIVLCIWFYYAPHTLLNLSYENVGCVKIKDINETVLILSTYDNNAGVVDMLISNNELKKLKRNNHFVRWKYDQSKISSKIQDLPLFKSYKILDFYGRGSGLIDKSVEKLKQGENVVILLKDFFDNKGIYYILQKYRVPILILKIKRKYGEFGRGNILKDIFGAKLKIMYEKITDYELGNDPEEFMKFIKRKLYDPW